LHNDFINTEGLETLGKLNLLSTFLMPDPREVILLEKSFNLYLSGHEL
jgi:hypothetical protein